jgi:AmmeMemoRadiSam system protein B
MSGTRPAAVASMFYPDDPALLRQDIQDMLADASLSPSNSNPPNSIPPNPKAIIVPHAGYMYSGSIAASAYARLIPEKDKIHKIVLLGPCHRVPLTGLATSSADYFETPLGSIKIDRGSINLIQALPQVQEFDLTHQQEHSLEVQLPFLQEIFNNFTLVPLVVGNTSATDVHEVIESLGGGDETLIVISSDLSHFHDYATAQKMDTSTCEAIEAFDGNAINQEQACGRNPILGLLKSAQKHNMKVTTLDLRNSGDTAGNKDQVVGYGAWMFEET